MVDVGGYVGPKTRFSSYSVLFDISLRLTLDTLENVKIVVNIGYFYLFFNRT